jgi:hypothetical protein
MYDALGIHWASSVPAFLALLCVPFPYLFYKYGSAIRARCKYSAESAEFVKTMREKEVRDQEEEDAEEKRWNDAHGEEPTPEGKEKENRREDDAMVVVEKRADTTDV